jgi:DUF971 family protein
MAPAVTELRLKKAGRVLEVDFADGLRAAFAAEQLRVESPSAEVQGHHPSERKLVAGKRHVAIIGIEPVGRYAVRLTFDDLHATGIFSWDFLHDLAREQGPRWDAYLAALAAAGLSR